MSLATPTHVHSKRDGQKFKAATELTTVTCATCSMLYAIPSGLHRAAREWAGDRDDGRGWKLCCPVGHTWWYTGKKTRAERLEEQLRVALLQSQAERDLREDTERRLRAQKGATTKAKKRAAAGVCPCCGRSFVQLRRHMASQHPDVLAEHNITPQEEG
jgi:hypothetical protein